MEGSKDDEAGAPVFSGAASKAFETPDISPISAATSSNRPTGVEFKEVPSLPKFGSRKESNTYFEGGDPESEIDSEWTELIAEDEKDELLHKEMSSKSTEERKEVGATSAGSQPTCETTDAPLATQLTWGAEGGPASKPGWTWRCLFQ